MQLSDLRVFIEPQQGATYDTQLDVALRAESLGFGAFVRSDHYLRIGDGDGLPGPTDAWITLAGLARDTTTIRLGTLVSPVTFRSPGLLAISVAQVDEMSGGRVELGLGAGWFEAEHHAYSFDFSDAAGRTRTPRLAARYATEFNGPFTSIEVFREQRERVMAACTDIGRTDPMTFSVSLVVCVGSSDADVARRAAAIGREAGQLRAHGAVGTVAEAADAIRRWHQAGAERIYLQLYDLHDLDHLDLIATDVIPLLS